jgi:bifunctional non-homologous end joining protein LigD
MRLRGVKEPFDHPDYLFELKHDGFRALVYLERGECRLVSHNLKQLRFDSLRKALAELSVESASMARLNGEDLRNLQLLKRKKRLSAFLCSSKRERILYAQHIEAKGRRFFEEICARDLEGVVAKCKLSLYRDDGAGWLKIVKPLIQSV